MQYQQQLDQNVPHEGIEAASDDRAANFQQDQAFDMLRATSHNPDERLAGVRDGSGTPSYTVNMQGNVMQLGMFEQKSEDVSATESRQAFASRAKNTIEQRPHRSARNLLERNRRRAYGIRERAFDMNQVRFDALQRRGRATQGALSALRVEETHRTRLNVQQCQLNRRVVSSARTVEREIKTN